MALTCPECQSARAVAHSFLANMFASCTKTVQTSCNLEWLCLVVLVCVVLVVLLVASVLASMRWLLCGGDGSEEKKKRRL